MSEYDALLQSRYQRQITLGAIGEQGQRKLMQSGVLVVGAGGLGSPALYYLCAAGIGRIGVADYDTVSESNLNRQILYGEADIGRSKALCAAQRMRELNASVQVETYTEKMGARLLDTIVPQYDIVVDCVDSVRTRLEVAAACHTHGVPLVEAGVEGFRGFVMGVVPGAACYACLQKGGEPKVGETPVFGAAAGVAGSIQSAECVKLLLGAGEPLVNKALFFDLLYQTYDVVALSPDPRCEVCGGP